MTLPPARPPGNPPGGKVLLVEDDDAMRQLCALVLTRAGHQTVTALDGEDAWRLLAEQPFDLLLTDNSMPGLSGLDLIDLIRRSGNLIPVIVASGSAGPDDLAAGNWPGYVRALPKPFLMTQLLLEVTAALRHARSTGRAA